MSIVKYKDEIRKIADDIMNMRSIEKIMNENVVSVPASQFKDEAEQKLVDLLKSALYQYAIEHERDIPYQAWSDKFHTFCEKRGHFHMN